MKGIINVSIAGIAFKLDEAAYTRLNDYLRQIRDSYGDLPEGEEIVSDLEARIAEIILTRQNTSVIVPLALVDEALAQLGAPEEISGSEGASSSAAHDPAASASSPVSGSTIAHRLYRNPDGAKLGGVCGGLGAYFNVDPTLVRLLFAAPLLLMIFFFILDWDSLGRTMVGFMTTAFILYPLLWVVIPKAKTPLQKLEMQGEKITREKLERTYREEFERRGNAPQYIEQRARSARNASVFSEIVSIFGRIVLFFLKAVVAIVGFGFFVAILSLLLALFCALFIPGSIHIDGLDVSPGWRMVLGCLVVLIPMLLAMYGILKFLFGFKHNKPLLTTMMVIWLLAFAFGTVIFIKHADEYHFDDNFISWHRNDDERRTQERESRREKEEALWAIPATPLTPTADTLYVAPAPGTDLPKDFVLNIRHRGDTTRLMLGNSLATETPPVDCSFRNDTLYLHRPADGISSGFDLNVSTVKAVVVAPGINTNEYYERINE